MLYLVTSSVSFTSQVKHHFLGETFMPPSLPVWDRILFYILVDSSVPLFRTLTQFLILHLWV